MRIVVNDTDTVSSLRNFVKRQLAGGNAARPFDAQITTMSSDRNSCTIDLIFRDTDMSDNEAARKEIENERT